MARKKAAALMDDPKAFAARIAKQTEAYWQQFIDDNEIRNDLVHRLMTPIVDARVEASAGADWRDPSLERAEHDVADVLTENPTKFDGVAAGETKAARDAADSLRLYCAAVWNQVNIGRWWDRSVGMGQARHGLKTTRKMARELDGEPTGSEDAREEWMRNNSDIFYIDDVETRANRWYPLRHPTVVVWEYETPELTAFNDYEVDGDLVGGEHGMLYRPLRDDNTSSGLKWVGDDYYPGEADTTMGMTCTVLVVEYEDTTRQCPVCSDGHYMWSGVEIIRASGRQISDGDLVSEYQLPWRGSSFMPTGGRESNDREPDLHYRPFLQEAYVHAANVNWATSRLMQIANEHSSSSGLWGFLDKDVPAQFAQQLQENGWTLDITEADEGQVRVMPPGVDIRPFPLLIAEALVKFEQDSYARLQNALPNRYILGSAYEEARASTGTAFERSVQQARVPFSYLLTQSDKTILEDFFNDGVLHYIRYTDYMDKQTYGEEHPERKYYVRLYEDVNSYLKRGGADDGKEIFLSASILEQNPKLVLKTQNVSLVEQAENRRQAIEGKQAGALTSRQLLEAFDFADTEKQMRLLEEERTRQIVQPTTDATLQRLAITIMAELADIDPLWMAETLGMSATPEGTPQTMPGQGGSPTGVGPGQPSVRLNPQGQVGGGPLPAPQQGAV